VIWFDQIGGQAFHHFVRVALDGKATSACSWDWGGLNWIQTTAWSRLKGNVACRLWLILVRVYSRSQNFIQSFPRHIKILSELEINLCNMNHILTFHYFPWLSAGSPIVCHVVYSSFLMVCVELWTRVPWLSCTGNDSSFLLLKNMLWHGCKKDVGTPCIIHMYVWCWYLPLP